MRDGFKIGGLDQHVMAHGNAMVKLPSPQDFLSKLFNLSEGIRCVYLSRSDDSATIL